MAFIKGGAIDKKDVKPVEIRTEGGIRYSVPSFINPGAMEDMLTVRFRVGAVYKDAYISVYFDDKRLQHKKKQVLAPGEMEQVIIKKSDLLDNKEAEIITIKIEQD